MTSYQDQSQTTLMGAACPGARPRTPVRLAWPAAFMAILLTAVAIRLWFLSLPIRFDEAFSYLHYVSLPFDRVISSYDTTNNHILNSVLMHAVYRLWGNAPELLRLPAMTFGILLVPAIYWTARRMHDRYAAMFAAALAASSSIIIEYSVNARGYSFVLLLFTVLTGWAVRLKDDPRPLAWIGFGALSSLGFWAIPIMLYPFVMVELWLFLSFMAGDSSVARNQGMALLGVSVVAAGLCSLVLYLPVLVTQEFHGMTALNPDATTKSLGYLLDELPGALWDFALLLVRDLSPPVAILLVAFLLLSPAAHRSAATHRVPFLWAMLLGFLVIMPVYRVVPYPRVMLFVHPMLLIAASSVFTWLMRRVKLKWLEGWGFPAAAAAYAVLACLLVVRTQSLEMSTQTGALPDAQAAARFLEAEYRPGDRLLMVHPSNEIIEYHFLRDGFPYGLMAATSSSDRGRVLIVVNLAHRQRLPYVLEQSGINPRTTAMRLLKGFNSALVVELRPE